MGREAIKLLIKELDCSVKTIKMEDYTDTIDQMQERIDELENEVKALKKPTKISIDVTKLQKDKFYVGKKGTWASLVIIPIENEHSTHIVFQDLGKDEKGEYIKGDIIGSAKKWTTSNEGNVVTIESNESKNEDDLPF